MPESYSIERLIHLEQYRIDPGNGLEFGIYTLGDHLPDPRTDARIPAEHTDGFRQGAF